MKPSQTVSLAVIASSFVFAFAEAACGDDDPSPAGTVQPDGGSTLVDATSADSSVQTTDAADAADSAAPAGRTIYAAVDGSHLVTFSSASPGTLTLQPTEFTNLAANEYINGLDFRPSNAALYGLSDGMKLYTLNLATAAATEVGAVSIAPKITRMAFDVNPVVDKLRVIGTTTGANYRLEPSNGAITGNAADTTLTYGGDAGTPVLVACAYTNSVAPAPAATVLYAIDQRGYLVKLDTPNTGVVTDVGPLDIGTTIASYGGFDIYGGAPASGTATALEAYAALTKTGDSFSTLFTIDLATGKATSLGRIGGTIGPVTAIAVK